MRIVVFFNAFVAQLDRAPDFKIRVLQGKLWKYNLPNSTEASLMVT